MMSRSRCCCWAAIIATIRSSWAVSDASIGWTSSAIGLLLGMGTATDWLPQRPNLLSGDGRGRPRGRPATLPGAPTPNRASARQIAVGTVATGTRDRILGVAAERFGTRGVDAVSLDEIAAEV